VGEHQGDFVRREDGFGCGRVGLPLFIGIEFASASVGTFDALHWIDGAKAPTDCHFKDASDHADDAVGGDSR